MDELSNDDGPVSGVHSSKPILNAVDKPLNAQGLTTQIARACFSLLGSAMDPNAPRDDIHIKRIPEKIMINETPINKHPPQVPENNVFRGFRVAEMDWNP